MNASDDTSRGGIRRFLNANTIGFAFLIAAVVVSLVNVIEVGRKMRDPNTIIIRLAHWQLELGYRNALQEVIDEYNMLHEAEGVKVVQMPVTEKVYQQWLNVHLISGTAPDIVEKGKAKMAQGEYTARFFIPLGEYVDDPNPYHKGTDLENVPWRDTLIDGMRGGFDPNLQDYYAIPTSFFTQRLFYNQDLLEEIYGTNVPPQTLGTLLDYCEKVREYAEKNDLTLFPIAGSSYIKTYFRDRYRVPFTYSFHKKVDINRDGYCAARESFGAFEAGILSFDNPRIKGWHEAVKSIASHFAKGWMAMDRQQAAFLFVQGDAAIIASGSWDAESLFKQADFDIIIKDVPLPGPGEKYSEFDPVRANEAQTAGGAVFGVYKFSSHKKWAIDFLQFLTSRKYNEQFNLAANWIPVTVGAEPKEKMKPFMPIAEGYSWGTSLDFGGQSTLKNWYEGKLWLYLQDEIAYENFSSNVMVYIRDERYGVGRVWFEKHLDLSREARVTDRLLSVLSLKQLTEDLSPTDDALLQGQYDAALIKQVQLNNAEGLKESYRRLIGEPMPVY